jgi:hypothetical protein
MLSLVDEAQVPRETAMPSRRKQKASFTPAEIAALVKSNLYLQRLVQDSKLRGNVRTAAGSVRHLYDRVSNGKVTARSLLEDKKAQADLRKALENLRDVTLALTEPPKKRRKLRPGRMLVVIGVGSGAALAASEKLRSKVLDLLFGAEEEFQYTPPPSTAPPSPPPAADAGSASTESADTAAATGTQTGSAPGSA